MYYTACHMTEELLTYYCYCKYFEMLSAFEVLDESHYFCIRQIGIRSISTVNPRFNGQKLRYFPPLFSGYYPYSILPHNQGAPNSLVDM
jgi:hypothetical protein